MNWIVPFISAVAAILLLYLSEPKRRKLAFITAILIIIPFGWQAYKEYTAEETLRERQIIAIKKLSGHTDGFLNIISDIIFKATDGWLPKNEEEFFSAKTADLICRELNIDKAAPIFPEITWRKLIAKETQGYKVALGEIMKGYGTELDAEIVNRISAVEGSILLSYPKNTVSSPKIDSLLGVKRPPLLCWGLEPLVADSLKEIFSLYEVIIKTEEDLKIVKHRDWLKFPIPHDRYKIGEDRFGPEDLKAWYKKYPNSPGPITFSKGSPDKGALPDERSIEIRKKFMRDLRNKKN